MPDDPLPASPLPNDGIPLAVENLDHGLFVDRINVAIGIILVGDTAPDHRPIFVVEIEGHDASNLTGGRVLGRFLLQLDGAETMIQSLTDSIAAWPT